MRLCLTVLISIMAIQLVYTQQSEPLTPYYPNEAIDYTLKYGIFKVGVAQLGFRFDKSCSDAFIIAEAKSSGLVKCFKNITYRYECYMDTATGLPISDSRILIEGSYEDINTVYYDRTTRSDSSLVYIKKTGPRVVPLNIYDLLSGFYHYRANLVYESFSNIEVFSITTFFIDEVW